MSTTAYTGGNTESRGEDEGIPLDDWAGLIEDIWEERFGGRRPPVVPPVVLTDAMVRTMHPLGGVAVLEGETQVPSQRDSLQRDLVAAVSGVPDTWQETVRRYGEDMGYPPELIETVVKCLRGEAREYGAVGLTDLQAHYDNVAYDLWTKEMADLRAEEMADLAENGL